MFNVETNKENKNNDEVKSYNYEDNAISGTYYLSFCFSYCYSNFNTSNTITFYMFIIGTNKNNKTNNQNNVKSVCVYFVGYIANVFL